ncbi:MAG TPA: cytochrome c oxidase subunit II transmembrane domain-containing protein, partial [Candidatus Binatia bacterium]
MLSWLPEDVSTFGGEIDRLFYAIYYITGVALVVVTALMIIFLIAYRRREGRKATYTHGNTALEITWTVIPAIV